MSIIYLLTAGALLVVALALGLGWIIWSLSKHQRWARPGRGSMIAAFTLVMMFWALPLRTARPTPTQQSVPQACRDSFDRDFVVAEAPTWNGSYVWDTTKCPNGRYSATVTATDTAGNVGTQQVQVTVLNLIRVPMTNIESPLRLFPTGGYLELITQDSKKRQFGLGDGVDRFAWSMSVQNNEVWIIEGTSLRLIRPAPRGSILRLSVTNGVVTYSRNGVVLFTSSRALTTAAKISATVEDADTTLGYLTIAGGAL